MSSGRVGVLTLLVAALVAYPFIPLGYDDLQVVYAAVALASLATAVTGVRSRPVRRRLPWVLVVGGFAAWLVADLLWVTVWASDAFPKPADALYLAGYVVLGAGALQFAPGRRSAGASTALIDSLIVTVGVAVPSFAFVVAPLSADPGLSPLGRVVASAYPVADLFILAVLGRLTLTSGALTPALRYLTASLGVTFLADCAYNVAVLRDPAYAENAWTDVAWLAAYVLLAVACSHPSMVRLASPESQRPARRSVPTLFLLAGGSMLPGVTLLVDGVGDGLVAWAPIGVGVIALSGLVLARMAILVRQVEVQATQLAAVARVDALTGAPNRRTWDHELDRACEASQRTGTPLSVAILDLDHFKRFNDEHGHPAGDQVLRDCVEEWSAALAPGQLLARYGGEEFTMLLPGLRPPQARDVVDRLRARTPRGQTFSAGVAEHRPGDPSQQVVAAADAALYRAKTAGRDRVEVGGDRPAEPSRAPVPVPVAAPVPDGSPRAARSADDTNPGPSTRR
ncbi:GGDEF domain-containing protein [uncultured Cellulomonas sp.]|uniref:GGDEF domain-containing protein n=1 Tax=uncultured Cellulomonas sp. TaxID=189682 RepID=UPI00262707C1|nr:GGDEF domain-containing protein [uncultured Cellulomonas sp.]